MYNEMLNMRGQKVRNLYKNLDNWLSNQNINSLMSQSIKFDYSDVIPISGIRVGDSDEKINTKIIIETKQ